MSETNNYQPAPTDEERTSFTEPRRQLAIEEDIPRANWWVALVFIPSGLIVGAVMLVVGTIILNAVVGVFPAGAAQIYPFAAFCVFGVWLSGKVFRRRPRWWSYVIVALVTILSNVNCQVTAASGSASPECQQHLSFTKVRLAGDHFEDGAVEAQDIDLALGVGAEGGYGGLVVFGAFGGYGFDGGAAGLGVFGA